MFNNLPAVWLVSIFSLTGIAAAQTTAPAPPVSTLSYRSAFEGYKPHTDDKPLNWKDANDTTGRIGGWRAYAKEASETTAVTQPADKAPAHDMANMPGPKPGGSKP